MASPRRIELPPSPAFRRHPLDALCRLDDYAAYQQNYQSSFDGDPIPGTELWVGDWLGMRINSLGCKGPELDPERGVIAFFGDSATFGITGDAWCQHVDVPGYQPLNCGAEGHTLPRICGRYRALSSRVRFDAVVHCGSWHHIVYNRRDEDFWFASFDYLDGDHLLAIATLSTCLDDVAATRGLEAHIADRRTAQPPFLTFGNWPPTPEKSRELYDGVRRYNDAVRSYCAQRGAILVDLFESLRPGSYDEMGATFIDPVHPRPESYPRLGAAASRALRPALAAAACRSAS